MIFRVCARFVRFHNFSPFRATTFERSSDSSDRVHFFAPYFLYSFYILTYLCMQVIEIILKLCFMYIMKLCHNLNPTCDYI